MTRSSPPPTVGYRDLFRDNQDFRNLFAGRLVSLFGDWFNLLAILAMLRAFGDTSATGFALVLVLKTLPAVLAPLAGVLADRLPRRGLMVFADVGRALVVLAMVGLTVFPSVEILYGLVVAQALLATVFEPARNALFPDLVRPEELTAANAVSAASWSLMLAVGSAAGGWVTDALGWELALLLDALTYVISAGFLLQIREPVSAQPAAQARTFVELVGLADLIQGWRWMLQRPRVWTLALVKPTWQLTGARTLVLTLLGETAFRLSEWPFLSVALLYIARGVGTGLGPVLARGLTASEPRAMERAILVGVALAGIGYVLLGLAPHLGVAVACIMVAHLGGATVWVFSTIRLQQLTPSPVRGRVFAAEHALFTLVMAASIGAVGQLDDGYGTALGAALEPWLPWTYAQGLPARALAIALGLITLVPFTFWSFRGALLGWGDAPSELPIDEGRDGVERGNVGVGPQIR